MLARKAGRDRQKVRNHPSEGMAIPQSFLLHSPLGILGMHTHVPGMSSKTPSLGFEQWSDMWESRTLTATLPAGPIQTVLRVSVVAQVLK